MSYLGAMHAGSEGLSAITIVNLAYAPLLERSGRGFLPWKDVLLDVPGSPAYFTCKGFTANAQPSGIRLTRISLPYCRDNFIFPFLLLLLPDCHEQLNSKFCFLSLLYKHSMCTYTCTYIFVHVSTSVHVYTVSKCQEITTLISNILLLCNILSNDENLWH